MKSLLFIPMFCLSILFIACGGDEKVDCLRDDFLGTYSGTTDCSEEPGTISITLAAGADETQLIVIAPEEADDDSGDIVIDLDFPPLTVNGCDVAGELEFGELGKVSVTGTKEGNTVTLNLIGSIFGETIDCSFEGTK